MLGGGCGSGVGLQTSEDIDDGDVGFQPGFGPGGDSYCGAGNKVDGRRVLRRFLVLLFTFRRGLLGANDRQRRLGFLTGAVGDVVVMVGFNDR